MTPPTQRPEPIQVRVVCDLCDTENEWEAVTGNWQSCPNFCHDGNRLHYATLSDPVAEALIEYALAHEALAQRISVGTTGIVSAGGSPIGRWDNAVAALAAVRDANKEGTNGNG